MFDIGIQEIIVIVIIALLIFGPKRLPELSRNIGKTLSDLKRAVENAKYQIDREIEETTDTPITSEISHKDSSESEVNKQKVENTEHD